MNQLIIYGAAVGATVLEFGIIVGAAHIAHRWGFIKGRREGFDGGVHHSNKQHAHDIARARLEAYAQATAEFRAEAEMLTAGRPTRASNGRFAPRAANSDGGAR